MSSNVKNCPVSGSYGSGWKPRELKVIKIIYDFHAKTDRQIKDIIQLEIDNVLGENPEYKFKDSKSHFNKTGGIELVLTFELK